jgi:hypothetical protein
MTAEHESFGPNRDEVWNQLAKELGGRFTPGGFWADSAIRAKVGPWTVTLDTHSSSTGQTARTFTRMRAPFRNRDRFGFTLYREGIFSTVGKLLGMQDVTIGHPVFDDRFIIKGTDEATLKLLFDSDRIRQLVAEQEDIHLEIRDDDGWFSEEFPEGVDELYFETAGTITDIDRLRSLYELFAETLTRLCKIGSAYRDDPGIEL